MQFTLFTFILFLDNVHFQNSVQLSKALVNADVNFHNMVSQCFVHCQFMYSEIFQTCVLRCDFIHKGCVVELSNQKVIKHILISKWEIRVTGQQLKKYQKSFKPSLMFQSLLSPLSLLLTFLLYSSFQFYGDQSHSINNGLAAKHVFQILTRQLCHCNGVNVPSDVWSWGISS